MVKVPVENGNLKKKCPKCQEVIAQEQLKCHVTVSELLPYFLDYKTHLKSPNFHQKNGVLKCAPLVLIPVVLTAFEPILCVKRRQKKSAKCFCATLISYDAASHGGMSDPQGHRS